ncbi:MAG: ATP-binding cassette domain-containing protein [Clostridiales bacterium]|nr:ATP-binding cassette domain-containing protein [Clostridiales bacterium]
MKITAKVIYNGSTVLDVKDVCFELGKKYALIGPNGSGKSTFLKCIAGLIRFDGETEGFDGAVYMPQNSFAFSMSTLSNVALAGKNKASINKEKAKRLLKKLEIGHLAKKNAVSLSGGEKQRMALARVLLDNHLVILLDEPTASCDAKSSLICERVIDEYVNESKAALIFATHSIKQAKRLADEFLLFEEGKITLRGKTGELDSLKNGFVECMIK